MAGHLVIVPTRALYDPELQQSPATFKALCVLSTFASTDDGWCFLLMSTIADRMNVNVRMARRHIQKLEKLGYVQRKYRYNKGFQQSSLYRVVLDAPYKERPVQEVPPSPVQEVPPSPVQEVPTERPFSNGKEKEKKALTRDEFLREIDKGYKADAFHEWPHLTETEIFQQADACLDFYGAKGEWPAGEPVPVLRYWIRQGVKRGSVRKAPAEKEARQETSGPKEPEQPLQPWQERIRPMVGEAAFRAWFLKMTLEHDRLIAPSKFHAEYVRQHYHAEMSAVCPGVLLTHQPTKEKELCTA